MEKQLVRAGSVAASSSRLWTRMARSIFPKAEFHLIEPQPACHPRLRDLVAQAPGMNLHPVVVTRPGVDRLEMIGTAKAKEVLGKLAQGDDVFPETQDARAALRRLNLIDR